MERKYANYDFNFYETQDISTILIIHRILGTSLESLWLRVDTVTGYGNPGTIRFRHSKASEASRSSALLDRLFLL